MLRLESLESGYPATRGVVVDAASLSLEAGEFVCIIGRNGEGKSTLMRTICGLQSAIGGESFLNAHPVSAMTASERAQSISVVTTDRVSSPGLLARDVIELGRQPYTSWHGQLTSNDREIVFEATQLAGAEDLVSVPFDSLSDGQRQRVMIARALAQSSKLMVLDELTAFLDLPGRVEIMALLRRHARDTGKIVLLSSHDLELSLEMAGQLWIVHDGRLTNGTADSLISTGVIERVFNNEEVSFNTSQRRFTLKHQPSKTSTSSPA